MKHTLLTLCLLLAFGKTEAQNNATKDETKYWLQNYGEALLILKSGYDAQDFGFSNKDDFIYLDLWKNENGRTVKHLEYYVPTNSISKISLTETSIIINSSKENIEVEKGEHGQTEKSMRNSLSLIFKDNESSKRFYKALQHYFSFFDYDIEFVNRQDIKNKF